MTVHENVAIFWDYENCAPPSTTPGYDIVGNIRQIAHEYGGVTLFKAYLDFAEHASSKSATLRSELQSCGVSLTDCPHNGRKDVADKMMMVDMLAYAIDTPAPATLLVISGDRDFVYANSVLLLRRYRIILITPSNAHTSLRCQATAVLDWDTAVLGKDETFVRLSLHRRAQSATTPANLSSPQKKARHRLSFREGPLSSDALPAVGSPSKPATLLAEDIAYESDTTPERFQTPRETPSLTFTIPVPDPAESLADVRTASPHHRDVQETDDDAHAAEHVIDSNVCLKDSAATAPLSPLSAMPPLVQPTPAEAAQTSESSLDNANNVNPLPPASVPQDLVLNTINASVPPQAPHAMEPPVVLIGIDIPLRPASSPPNMPGTDEASLPITKPTDEPNTLGITPTTPESETRPSPRAELTPVPIALAAAEDSPRLHNPRGPYPPDVQPYAPLLRALAWYRDNGEPRPDRSDLAQIMNERKQDTYQAVGVTRWKEYAAKAAEKGLIVLGSKDGCSWISLSENWGGAAVAKMVV